MPITHERSAWPGGSPSVRSSAKESAPTTSDNRIVLPSAVTAEDASGGSQSSEFRYEGENVTLRRATRSAASEAGRSVRRRRISASATRISISANAAPMQRRTPPPNGTHA